MGKKMKGLVCHSSSSTAIVVCMGNDHHRRSVVTPTALIGQARSINSSSKYIRLGDHPAIPPTPSCIRKISFLDDDRKDDHQEKNKKQPQLLPNLAFQVVVMRVSLHCQGCAVKVKRHLSRMDGVTWFGIELESKRVTVMGHVSPSAVVDSISKVKKAELWPAAAN